jgi:hypothetical protein
MARYRKNETNGNEFAGFGQEMIGYARAHLNAIIADTKAKLDRLNQHAGSVGSTIPIVGTDGKTKRTMSAAARKRISERMKQRWAVRKAPATPPAVETPTEAPKAANRNRKGATAKKTAKAPTSRPRARKTATEATTAAPADE